MHEWAYSGQPFIILYRQTLFYLERSEEFKKMTSMLKGHYGKLDLLTRLAKQEWDTAYRLCSFQAFKQTHKEEHEKLHNLINDCLDELTKAIECVQDEVLAGSVYWQLKAISTSLPSSETGGRFCIAWR